MNDPTDLARLTAVSRGMRAAVAATKRTIKKPDLNEAVENGYLSTLKHMHSFGRLLCKELVCATAASSGQLEELKSMRAEKWPWDEETCSWAASGGHLKVLKWACANGCPWDVWTCAQAARGGHIEVLKWARTKGCPWDWKTCAYAAKGGHLEVLKWARANDCPWTDETRQLAKLKWPEVFA